MFKKKNIKTFAKFVCSVLILLPLCIGTTGCDTNSSSNSSSSAIASIAEKEYNNYVNKTDGSIEGGQKYLNYMGLPSGTSWCASFVSWCANEAGLYESGYTPKDASVAGWIDYYKKNPDKGDVIDGKTGTPRSGDLIVWQRSEDNGEALYNSHIGIVISFTAESNKVKCIEGNGGSAGDIWKSKYDANTKVTYYLRPKSSGSNKETSFGCSTKMSSGGGSLEGNPLEIYQFFSQKELGDVQIAGILGNLDAESGCNPKRCQDGFGQPREVDNYPESLIYNNSFGYGIAQWSYWSRANGLVKYAKKKNTNSGDLTTQLEWMYQEMDSYGLLEKSSKFWTTSDVSEATLLFHNIYESSADDASRLANRIKSAENFYSEMQNGGSSSTSWLSGCSTVFRDSSEGLIWPTKDEGSGQTWTTYPDHNGIDIPASSGSEVLAVGDGEVIKSEYNSSYGYTVMIYHPSIGIQTRVAHMKEEPKVKVGDTVYQGDVVGYCGSTGNSTGPHIHFEIYEKNSRDYFYRDGIIYSDIDKWKKYYPDIESRKA